VDSNYPRSPGRAIRDRRRKRSFSRVPVGFPSGNAD
jgi:hypothetical protein